jgi:hypothetical protein
VDGALSLTEGAGRYIDFGIFHVSVANAIVILAGLAIFVLALVLPFPHSRGNKSGGKS